MRIYGYNNYKENIPSSSKAKIMKHAKMGLNLMI